ncbi:hypothetical protein NL676_028653 [Syzygium grande]|nr:hypothetical protein NL676_028653 [Syzygium grande]
MSAGYKSITTSSAAAAACTENDKGRLYGLTLIPAVSPWRLPLSSSRMTVVRILVPFLFTALLPCLGHGTNVNAAPSELNVKRSDFPADFLFGAATSAVQGNRRFRQIRRPTAQNGRTAMEKNSPKLIWHFGGCRRLV